MNESTSCKRMPYLMNEAPGQPTEAESTLFLVIPKACFCAPLVPLVKKRTFQQYQEKACLGACAYLSRPSFGLN